MQVDAYTVQGRTNARGAFFYRVDTTLPQRHVVVNKDLYDMLAALPELADVPRP